MNPRPRVLRVFLSLPILFVTAVLAVAGAALPIAAKWSNRLADAVADKNAAPGLAAPGANLGSGSCDAEHREDEIWH
jgi:hypothetical protein